VTAWTFPELVTISGLARSCLNREFNSVFEDGLLDSVSEPYDIHWLFVITATETFGFIVSTHD